MSEHNLRPEVRALISRLDVLLPPLLATQRSSWEQGVTAQAFLECHCFFDRRQTIQAQLPVDFLRYIYAFVHEALVRQAPDGRLAVLLNGDGSSDPGAADPASIGECLYFLLTYIERHGRSFTPPKSAVSETFAEGVDRMLRYIMDECPRFPVTTDNPADQGKPLLSHRIDTVQIWSDTLYMLPSFLVSAAIFHLTRPNPRYASGELLRLGLEQILLASHALQALSGEWNHIYDLANCQYVRKAFWGVGNGWVCCGIVRVVRSIVLAASPRNTDRVTADTLVQLFEDDLELGILFRRCYDMLCSTITACLKYRRADGLFHDVLDDPSTFVETNLAQQLSYAIFRLFDLQDELAKSPLTSYLPSKFPLASLDLAWEVSAQVMYQAAAAKVDEWGFVRDVWQSDFR